MIVGIDVSKQVFDCAWGTSNKVNNQVFEYTNTGISELLKLTPEDAFYVMEATGVYHTQLALGLHDAGRKVCIVNPLVIKRYSQMSLSRVKSDRADAQLIRAYGIQNELKPWVPSSETIVELKQAHSWLDDLIRDQTRLLNREEALTHQVNVSQFVSEQMAEQKKQFKEQIKACEHHLDATVKKAFPDLYQRLQTIPSIGNKTATELIIITHGFERFSDVKALSAYAGISPTTYRSGTSVRGRGGIAKMGRGRIRQLLYLCSWTAKTCNTGCKSLYDRLEAAGKPKKVINIAVAHKLLRQAFAVAISGKNYSLDCA